MTSRKLSLAAWILGASLLASSALALSTDTRTLERDHEDPWQTARVQLFFTTSNRDVVYLYVTLRIEDEAPLRVGEYESWQVRGELHEGLNGGAHRVWVTVDSDVAYHDYPARLSGNVYCHSTMNYVDARFGHDGRIMNGAPAAFAEADVSYTTPEEPLELSFRDAAFEANGEAETNYRFAFYTRGLLGGGKKVAAGEFAHVPGERQRVTIEKDGPFTGDSEAWFEAGDTYWVVIKFQRLGTEWYSDEFGPGWLGTFQFEEGGGKLLPLAELEHVPGEGEPTAEQQLFRELHAPAAH